MDNQKFGMFIADLRKKRGMTQADLAKVLHVTDKAVSKWERGVGFPDIKTIQPLADALGISTTELLNAECIQGNHLSANQVDNAVKKVIDTAIFQQIIERRNLLIVVASIIALILLIFVIDQVGWLVFFIMHFPLICFFTGIALLIFSLYKRRKHSPFRLTLLLAILALTVPLLNILLFAFAFLIGGPFPT